MSKAFVKNGYVVIVKQDHNEPYSHFLERGMFIVDKKPTVDTYDNIVKYSRIFINTKYLKCSYNKEVMDNLKKLIN